ncbi:MAG: hypothetical protein IPO19_18420 [Rhodoferax sp.]|nr:hypothetical protein [Rhodoferax sp.]
MGLVPAPASGWDSLWQDADFQAVRASLEAEEPSTAVAPMALRLQDPKLIPEGVAHDARTRRFFVGSVAQHKIVVVDARSRSRDFSVASDRLDAVLGLAVDERRRALYAVSTNALQATGARQPRNAVVRYDLRSGKLAARYEVSEAKQLNDVALAADGTAYVTDSAAGSLYRLRTAESAFSRIGEVGALRGANGVTVAPDGTLYVTLSTGIARVMPDHQQFERLAQPDTVVTGGIDGLYWYRGDLLGIQNTSNPGRVVRIHLAPDGGSIVGLTVLQSHHHPAFAEPTTGALVGDTLYVIANSHFGRYQGDGSMTDAATLQPTVLLAVPLR